MSRRASEPGKGWVNQRAADSLRKAGLVRVRMTLTGDRADVTDLGWAVLAATGPGPGAGG
jgi:hypothetical protein